MTDETPDSQDSADKLGEILVACIEAVDHGDANADMIVARYPEYAAELREFFAAQERAEHLAAPLQSLLQAQATVGTAEVSAALPNPLGDFRILREVGRGGMGVVYEAEQVSLGRRVALKVLPLAAAMDPRGLQRFQNEARAAASLHHTNIAPVYAVGSERGIPFYAMQFIDGQTLAAVLAQLRRRQAAAAGGAPEAARDQPTSPYAPAGSSAEPAPEGGRSTAPVGLLSTAGGLRGREFYRVVAGLGVQAAEALDCAHQLGVVHRDVKPANLMVEAAGHLWVTDFGLARVQADASITATGDLVGTLRYMSPEQALAKRVVIDHRTDIYSLGATLYELLTLRPVCPGRDRQEVLRQIAFEEPRPPRRLNRAVPAELEVVVLKALEKSTTERYATAQELADDLRRWLDDRPILARRPSWARLAARWARRHKPLVGAALAVLVMAAVLGGGTWLWWAQKRAGAEGEARAALREAAGLLEEERWPEALSAARRAEGALAGVGADSDLRRQARTLVEDLEMARRLQEARLQGAAVKDDGHFDWEAIDATYTGAFKEYGLFVDGFDPQAVAEQIRARPIHRQLVAAMDDWALIRRDLEAEGWKQRLAVARAADPDTRRNRLRHFVETEDGKTLEEVIAADAVGDWPPPTLELLGRVARGAAGSERVAVLLGQAQRRHPDDFWINETLGMTLHDLARSPHLEEAIRFFSVAVALRPQSPTARLNLASALHSKGRLDEAEAECREAIRLKKDYPEAHCELGRALKDKGLLDEAVAEYREAIRLKKDYPEAHCNLGIALKDKGLLDEAVAEYREAIRLKKDYFTAHGNLSNALRDKGLLDEAITEVREAIRLNKDSPEAHNNLSQVLFKKGRLDEAEAESREAIRLKKDLPEAHCNLGNALFQADRLDEAIAEYRESIRLKNDYAEAHGNLGAALMNNGQVDDSIPEFREALRLKEDYPETHCNLGNALREKGRLDEAIAEYREAIRLKENFPGAHNNLGVALRAKGQFDEAIAEFRTAIRLKQDFPLAQNNLAVALKWKALVEKLPGILKGEAQPADAAERLALAHLCREYKKRYAAAARFCAEAFASQPGLAADMEMQHRYNAACAAALAGCGQGVDADILDTKERARLRKQALDWLRADLKAYRQAMDKSADKPGPEIAQRMQHWLQDTDFTGVRGPEALGRLPESERGDWQKLWDEVQALRQRAAKLAQPASPPRP